MSYDYDVTVIGGGPGGYVAAIRAAKLGKKTCLIEKNKLGGTCLNVGCIPAKTFVKTAELYSSILSADNFAIEGIDKAAVKVNMDKLCKRKAAVTKQLTGGVASLLRANHVEVINSCAEFSDSHTVLTDGKSISSDYFILATGSENFVPSSIAFEGSNNLLTNVEFLELNERPDSMIVLGAGVVGLEFACVMNSLGCDVSVVELSDHILPSFDCDIADAAKKHMEKNGIKFFLDSKIYQVKDNTVSFKQGDKSDSLYADTILLSLGRRPILNGLGLEKAGVAVENGVVACDAFLRTTAPNIYAVGDVNGKKMLAGTASHEGIFATENICGENKAVNYDTIPMCAYLSPEVASLGMTEAEAKEKYGDDIKVGRVPIAANGRALTAGESDGIFKVILEKRFGEILGVHIFAPNATEMISEFSLAMYCELTADEVLGITHPHPTINEAVGEAFLAAWRGGAIHSM